MKNQYLNTGLIIKGKIGNLVNAVFKNKTSNELLPGYKFIKDLTPPYKKDKKRVGIYLDKLGNKVVIKKKIFFMTDLETVFLSNEAYVLSSLNKIKDLSLVSKFLGFKEEKNRVYLITALNEGKTIDQFTTEKRWEIVKKTVQELYLTNRNLTKEKLGKFPSVGYLSIALSFPLKLIKTIFENPRFFKKYLTAAVWFYFNLILSGVGGYQKGLVHRDLYPDNIIYSKPGGIKLLDWESAVLADPLCDLSQIAMIYCREVGVSEIVTFLRQYLNNNSERRRFVALALFNSFLILSSHKRGYDEFKAVDRFIDDLSINIFPELIYQKSPFETINGITLDLVWWINRLVGFPKFSRNKKLMLCYHSIGNNGWRFATRTEDFKKQINFLKQNYQLVGLSELLKRNGKGVHISFDDGYLDVYQNALPILGRIPATMFALGNFKDANRKELDNNLPIMDFKILKKLSKKGWTIGSHTMTHANLRQISDLKLKKEIFESKRDLEKNLGIDIKYLAYPKGGYSNKITDFTRLAGYNAAFTVDGKEMTFKNMMLLDRIPTEGEMSIRQFEAMLSPLGIFITKIFLRILQIKEYSTIDLTKRKAVFSLN